MNPWTVDWDLSAEQELARIWMQVADPQAVTVAQARIDRLLARDPFGNGRHLAEGLYKLSEPPLTVFYRIDEDQRLVYVDEVGYIP
jgi:hypothetical protein